MEQDSPTGARVGLAVAGIAGLVFVVLAVVLVPWHWLPGEHVRAVPADEVFSKAQIEHNEHVGWLFRLPSWANLVVGLGVSLWLGLSRRGSRLVERSFGPWWWVKGFVATGAVTAVVWVAQLPLSARIEHVAREEGLSSRGWNGWLLDEITGVGVAWAFTAIGVLVVLAIARKAPRTWPAWAAAAGASLAMVGSFVYPVVVEPLFNDFTSLPDGQLRTEIFALAEKEKVPIDDVLVADASRRTTTLNAYVSGFGSTRRVVLYDNVLTDLPRAETEMIVAHELGHAKHDDVLVGTVLGAVGSAFGIGLLGWLLTRRRLLDRVGADGPGDPRVIPVVLALAAVAALLASPVQNTISRAVEARADLTSLEATGDADTFTEMQRQLTLKSLADPTPPRISQFWFGSHPTVLQRVGLARLFARTGE